MATNVRSGRSGSRFSFAGRTGKSGLGRTSTQCGTGGKRGAATVPTAYRSCCNNFANKIQSFKTLVNQTKGAAKFQRPTPTTLNSFANWINKGAVIQTVTPAQVARWAKSANKNFNTKSASPTTCKNVLCAKFGKNTIKAVCRTKNGTFMVATSPVVKGRSFCFPK